MSVPCLICNKQFRNKYSFATHNSRYHSKCDELKAEIPSENDEHPKYQTDVINEVGLGCQKDVLQTGEEPSYSSTCPFSIKDLAAPSSTSNIDPPCIPKRRSRKNNIRTNPFSCSKKAKTSFYENDDVTELLTALNTDLQN